MRRRLQSAHLRPQKTQGRVTGTAAAGTAESHGKRRPADPQRAVANRRRGRGTRGRATPERGFEERRARRPILRAPKAPNEQRLERRVQSAKRRARRFRGRGSVVTLIVREETFSFSLFFFVVFFVFVLLVFLFLRLVRVREFAPPQNVAKVKLPRRAPSRERPARLVRRRRQASHERDHALDDLRGHRGVQRPRDVREVVVVHRLDVHPGEPVQERFRQAFPSAALLDGVLRGKHPERRGAPKRLPELRHEHLRPVVQRRVEALQHALRREVELVQQHPVPVLHRGQKRPVRPPKNARVAAVRGQIRAQKVHHVRLLAQVDANERVAGRPG